MMFWGRRSDMKSLRSIWGIEGRDDVSSRRAGRGEFHALQWKNGVLTSVSAPPSPETAAAGTPENATKARCASSIILASAPGTPPEEPPADMRVRSQICASNRAVFRGEYLYFIKMLMLLFVHVGFRASFHARTFSAIGTRALARLELGKTIN